jgi:hypothetical protein
LYGNPNVLTPGVSTTFCAWQSADPDIFFNTYTIPISIYFFSALILCCHAVFVCIRTSAKVSSTARVYLEKIWKSYGMIIMFLFLYVIFFLPIAVSCTNNIFFFLLTLYFILLQVLLLLFTNKSTIDDLTNGSLDWFICLLTTFVSNESTNSNYMKKMCGSHPKIRFPFSIYPLEIALIYVWAIGILYISMTNDVKAFWWNLLIRFLNLTHISTVVAAISTSGGFNIKLDAVKRSR